MTKMNKLEVKDIVITNRGKQMIPIQVRPPNGDFFYEEHQIRLNPGKSITLPKHFLNWAQIENCQARGNLSIIESK